jgi:nitrogen-specific signal transduction histidine kinase
VKRRKIVTSNALTPLQVAEADPPARSQIPHNPDRPVSGQIPIGFVRAVRAPLSAIESAGYVLEDSAFTDANHREVAAIILNECHRLDVLIRLLEFGHTQSPRYREVDLSSVLDEIVRCGEVLERLPGSLCERRKSSVSEWSAIHCSLSRPF